MHFINMSMKRLKEHIGKEYLHIADIYEKMY